MTPSGIEQATFRFVALWHNDPLLFHKASKSISASCSSAVETATGLRVGDFGVRIPVRREFLISKKSSVILGPNQPPLYLVPRFFFGDKAAAA